jgi:hypothetical protein
MIALLAHILLNLNDEIYDILRMKSLETLKYVHKYEFKNTHYKTDVFQ